jgi:hypothetical protein
LISIKALSLARDNNFIMAELSDSRDTEVFATVSGQLHGGKLFLTLVSGISFLFALFFALAAFVLMHVYATPMPRPQLAALFLAHTMLPLNVQRGSERARIALGSLFLLEEIMVLVMFGILIRAAGNLRESASFGIPLAVAAVGFAYCSYLLFFSGSLRAEVHRRSAVRPHRIEAPWYAAPGFWLWLPLLYYFARWLTDWYITSVLADPRWLAGRVSVAESDFLGAITFVVAGIVPFIWLASRHFEYRRSFGPLLLWTILVPASLVLDYLTSAASPLR